MTAHGQAHLDKRGVELRVRAEVADARAHGALVALAQPRQLVRRTRAPEVLEEVRLQRLERRPARLDEGGPPLVDCMVAVWWLCGDCMVVLKVNYLLLTLTTQLADDPRSDTRMLYSVCGFLPTLATPGASASA